MNPEEPTRWLEELARSEPTGQCVEWPWRRTTRGYGELNKKRVTHIVLELTGRERPTPDHMTLHACDNPPCCAPWHIRWGTNQENVAERVERGNNLRGEDHGMAKMTADDVRMIRRRAEAGASYAQLAREYGMTSGHIRRVVERIRWAHLP